MRLQNGYDPIVPRDFLQKRHLRQSHCKMSIPTFVQTVVLSLLTFVQSLIRLAQMLWYFGFILTFFPSKRLGVKEAFQKGFQPHSGVEALVVCSYQLCRRWLLYTEVGQMCLAVIKTKKNVKRRWWSRFEWVEKNLDFLWGLAARWRQAKLGWGLGKGMAEGAAEGLNGDSHDSDYHLRNK